MWSKFRGKSGTKGALLPHNRGVGRDGYLNEICAALVTGSSEAWSAMITHPDLHPDLHLAPGKEKARDNARAFPRQIEI
jgi:hypothetical protein